MAKVAFTAPHRRAAEIGFEILKEGGTAVDAMVAAAAAIAVVYPHMNSLGGDGFWLIQKPGKAPVAIDACGNAGSLAKISEYQAQGLSNRGGRACITMAGTVAGWQLAREWAGIKNGFPLARLLGPAQELAAQGIKATESLQRASEKTFAELKELNHFASIFLPAGKTLVVGDTVTNPGLADMLEHLHRSDLGLRDFYQGDISSSIASGLRAADSPITHADLQQYQAEMVTPLSATTSKGQLFNMVAPTQGVASLMILALYDRLYQSHWSEAQRVHHLVECTKLAFEIRDREVCDRRAMTTPAQEYLEPTRLDQMALQVDAQRAAPWPKQALPGDTVWLGALDRDGTLVSFIQSVYWEFGSGLVIPDLGLVWNNRGISFALEAGHHNALAPGKKPLHTLNPALALLNDGRRFSYGTMGGEGQPQTQAALYTRHIYQQIPLADAIAQDRWLLGRTWGESSNNLKLEQTLYEDIGPTLSKQGHDIEALPSGSESMGHAGGIILSSNGDVQVATDPRSDGAALVA